MPDPVQSTPLRNDDEIIEELERVAELVRHHPELNHHSADRLMAIARDMRADLDRAKEMSRLLADTDEDA